MATPTIEIDVDGRDIRVTNPDKVYFPAVRVTNVYQKLFPKFAPDWMQKARVTFPSGRSVDACA